MRIAKRFTAAWALGFMMMFTQHARAADLGDVLRALAIGAGVKTAAKPINDFINTATANRKMPVGASTKVVPILSVGEKGYIGAAQVAGPAAQVNQVEALFRFSAAFQDNKYRIMLLFPNSDLNPLKFERVSGVGLTALVDFAISGAAPALSSGGIDTGDAVRAAAIGAAITQVSKPLNDFINTVYSQKKSATKDTTKVVPSISVGERAYIGGMQVSGPSAAVSKVKAVFIFDELLDSGRYRINLIVPGDTINPLKFNRVKGVGVSAVIDTTVATSINTAGKNQTTTAANSPRALGRTSGDAAVASDWIDHAHAYIEAAKKDVDQAKLYSKTNGKKGKGKGKGKNNKANASAANKRLAEARKTLAKARKAQAKSDFTLAVELAQQSMRIADQARALIK